MLSVDQLEDKLIDLAFAEDIGDGDHTTLCCIPEDAMGRLQAILSWAVRAKREKSLPQHPRRTTQRFLVL